MTPEEAAVRLAEIRKTQRDLAAEVAHLQRLVSHPSVDVVLVYWRYRHEHRDVESCTVAEGLATLDTWGDEGFCSAVGVEVGGVLIQVGEEP